MKEKRKSNAKPSIRFDNNERSAQRDTFAGAVGGQKSALECENHAMA